jgi:hypothetical protein
MFSPLVAAVSPEEFLSYDLELQISMFESLVRVYGAKFLPDWLRAVYCYALDFPHASEIMAHAYPALLEFAATYAEYVQADFSSLAHVIGEEEAAHHWFAEQKLELAA